MKGVCGMKLLRTFIGHERGSSKLANILLFGFGGVCVVGIYFFL